MTKYLTVTELFNDRVESQTIRRLLVAGVECFWRKGFHASSTREIAKRAKLSPAAVYVHFTAKEDLLFMIILVVAENLRDHLRELSKLDSTPTELLQRIVLAYITLPVHMFKASLVANREFSSLTVTHRKQIVKIRDELENILANCLTDGKLKGEFYFENLSITRIAVLSLFRSILLWYKPRGKHTPEDIAMLYVDLVLNMVRGSRVIKPQISP
jgi:AcrR family transcriptional regulator